MGNRELTEFIIVSTTRSDSTQDLGPKDVDRADRKLGFFGACHHWLIRRCGTVVPGRDPEGPAMGLKNRNATSVLVRVVGGTEAGVSANNFNRSQLLSLRDLLSQLQTKYPDSSVEMPDVLRTALKEING